MSPISNFVAIVATLGALASSVQAVPVVESRSLSGTATWFEVGLGACGWTNVDSDYIVALQTESFDSGAHCGKKISITTKGGKTAEATVVDECPSCDGAGSIDLSPSLFKHFGNLDLGVMDVSWSFN